MPSLGMEGLSSKGRNVTLTGGFPRSARAFASRLSPIGHQGQTKSEKTSISSLATVVSSLMNAGDGAPLPLTSVTETRIDRHGSDGRALPQRSQRPQRASLRALCDLCGKYLRCDRWLDADLLSDRHLAIGGLVEGLGAEAAVPLEVVVAAV